jgi:hypothetical protein
MAAVCVAVGVLAFAVGALAPWRFLQELAADLIGGLLAGLVIFGLANIAFGFTERRERERHALRIAYDILFPELMDNLSELQRIVKVLREGSLSRSDPVLGRAERLSVETWQLLVQSPLVAHLDPDLLWKINMAYYVSRRFVREIRESDSAVLGRSPQGWRDFSGEQLAKFETALRSQEVALEALKRAQGGDLSTSARAYCP